MIPGAGGAPSRPASTDPAPAQARLRVGFAALFLCAVAAEVLSGGSNPTVRNLLADLGLAAIVLSVCFLPRSAEDPQARGSRALAIAVPAGVALLASCRTLGLPYLSDDWCHVAVLRECPTPLHAFGTSIGALFLRPVGWCVWWCLARASPTDGALAHAVCVALFMVDAVLVVPALRRCGATRGVAIAAAVCFAASPIVAGTVAWPSNLYGILSTGFSLAAIATLPRERSGFGRAAGTFVLAALACLSKEDAFVLPVVLAAAGAGFRLRDLGRGIRLAVPAVVALLAVIALRSAYLGGAGGYTDVATGRSMVVHRWLTGLSQGARSEFPTTYFLTWFTSEGASLAKSLCALVPLALLGLGGASKVARRQVPRALFLTLVALVPVVWTLPIGAIVVNARQLFLPSAFLGWIVAGLVAGGPLGPWFRATCFALYVAASLFVGLRNHRAWEAAGLEFRRGAFAVAPLVASAPANARVLVHGLPEYVDGAPCFLNATGFALPLLAGRPDVEGVTQPLASAELDLVIEFDPSTGSARDVTWPELAALPAPQTTVDFDFAAAETRANARLSGWSGTFGRGAWNLTTNGASCTVRLPVLAVRPDAEITIRLDAPATNGGRPFAPIVLVTSEAGKRLLRRPVAAEESFRLPSTARTLRIEIGAPIGTRMALRRVLVSMR